VDPEFNQEAVKAIRNVRRSTGLQLLGMAQWATDPSCHDCLHSIAANANEHFTAIEGLAGSEQIRPLCQIMLSEGDSSVLVEERPLRVGVYPLAANPLHWGHVLLGLSTMASMRLDKVVFVIAGTDSRKPSLLSAETRHRLGRSVIETFDPVFAYSSWHCTHALTERQTSAGFFPSTHASAWKLSISRALIITAEQMRRVNRTRSRSSSGLSRSRKKPATHSTPYQSSSLIESASTGDKEMWGHLSRSISFRLFLFPSLQLPLAMHSAKMHSAKPSRGCPIPAF